MRMPVYLLSYRLADDGGATERRLRLMRAVHGVCRRFWDRTDQAIIFETAHTAAYLGDLFKAEIDLQRDVFLLCEIGTGAGLVCGANSDPEILALLPECRALDA